MQSCRTLSALRWDYYKHSNREAPAARRDTHSIFHSSIVFLDAGRRDKPNIERGWECGVVNSVCMHFFAVPPVARCFHCVPPPPPLCHTAIHCQADKNICVPAWQPPPAVNLHPSLPSFSPRGNALRCLESKNAPENELSNLWFLNSSLSTLYSISIY